jgi:hypothetical protein
MRSAAWTRVAFPHHDPAPPACRRRARSGELLMGVRSGRLGSGRSGGRWRRASKGIRRVAFVNRKDLRRLRRGRQAGAPMSRFSPLHFGAVVRQVAASRRPLGAGRVRARARAASVPRRPRRRPYRLRYGRSRRQLPAPPPSQSPAPRPQRAPRATAGSPISSRGRAHARKSAIPAATATTSAPTTRAPLHFAAGSNGPWGGRWTWRHCARPRCSSTGSTTFGPSPPRASPSRTTAAGSRDPNGSSGPPAPA